MHFGRKGINISEERQNFTKLFLQLHILIFFSLVVLSQAAVAQGLRWNIAMWKIAGSKHLREHCHIFFLSVLSYPLHIEDVAFIAYFSISKFLFFFTEWKFRILSTAGIEPAPVLHDAVQVQLKTKVLNSLTEF